MADHPSPELLARYRDGALTVEELLAVDDHLVACEVCQQRGTADIRIPPSSLDVALRGTTLDDHPDFETLEGYVDGGLDSIQREIVEAHLTDCQPCAEDAGDLRKARASMHLSRERETAGQRPFSALAWMSWRRMIAGAGLLATAGALAWMLTPPSNRLQPPSDQTVTRTSAPPSDSGSSGDASLVASLRDGGSLVSLDQQGTLKGLPSSVAAADHDGVIDALRHARAVIPDDIVRLSGRTGVLMGDASRANALALIAPMATAVESDRPRFRWTEMPTATTYVVTLYDGDFNEVARSGSMTTTDWTVPEPLKRGVTYSWQVTATTAEGLVQAPAPPAPLARFRVVDARTADDVARAREAHPDSHLALGVVYARAGILEAAEREFLAVKSANPESRLADSLLASVQRRGQ
jgi:anti-sigma factor RsiW